MADNADSSDTDQILKDSNHSSRFQCSGVRVCVATPVPLNAETLYATPLFEVLNSTKITAFYSRSWNKKRTAEPQNIECRMSKDGFALLSPFYKIDRSTTEAHDGQNTFLRHSIFMIRHSLFSFLRTLQSWVSFLIKLAAFQICGGADT
jgi:hypothetical protein